MVQLRRTGRTPHELAEVPPELLHCGHRNGPRRVTVGYGARPDDPDGRRVRTYRCWTCGGVTYTAADG